MQFSQLFSLFWCPWDSWLHTALWEVLLSYFCWCWVGAPRRQLLVSGGWWYKCNSVCFEPEVAVLSLHQPLKKSTAHFLFSACCCTVHTNAWVCWPLPGLLTESTQPFGSPFTQGTPHPMLNVASFPDRQQHTDSKADSSHVANIPQLSSTVATGISWTGNASCPQLLCSVGWYRSRLYMYLNNLMLSP